MKQLQVLRHAPETISNKKKGGLILHPSFYVGSGMKNFSNADPE
jgi:hypothetical protein